MSINFTHEQNRIFQFVENESGHGIIDAVAGAGKTITIMECARFIKDKTKILFCAFNNSISNEIARKFHQLGMNEVSVKTIHSLGRSILQANNNTGKPITLEEEKYKVLLKNPEIQDKISPYIERIIEINGFEKSNSNDERNRFAVNNIVYRINNRLLDINQKFRATLTKEEVDEFEKMVIHFGIFNEFEIAKKNFKEELNNYFECHSILLNEGNLFSKETMIIDYTDMLYLPFKWNQHPSVKYDFLFIDECQDLSYSQFAVATKYGKRDSRILAVGDPIQSIYGFTGADIDSFNRVKQYTKAKELPLTACFRCPKKVVTLAQTIRTDMIGVKEQEGVVTSIQFDDIVNLAKPNDLIISRLRAPLVLLVFSFIDKNIKVQIHEDEVKEIINELKNIFKPDELNVLISSLSDGFNGIRFKVLSRWDWIINKNSERIIDSSERNFYIDSEKKYLQKKLDFFENKYEQWKEECSNLKEIIKRIKEFISSTDNPIKLSTIHRAKGLENERVFILNYDELPYQRMEQKDWEKTQEINLKYVAITRALSELFLIESKNQQSIEAEGSLFDTLPFV